MLELDNSFDARWAWLGLLAALILATVYLSVLRQWKPFLITGLAYVVVWAVRLFAAIDTELDNSPTARAVATLGLMAAGVVLMLVAGIWRPTRNRVSADR